MGAICRSPHNVPPSLLTGFPARSFIAPSPSSGHDPGFDLNDVLFLCSSHSLYLCRTFRQTGGLFRLSVDHLPHPVNISSKLLLPLEYAGPYRQRDIHHMGFIQWLRLKLHSLEAKEWCDSGLSHNYEYGEHPHRNPRDVISDMQNLFLPAQLGMHFASAQ